MQENTGKTSEYEDRLEKKKRKKGRGVIREMIHLFKRDGAITFHKR